MGYSELLDTQFSQVINGFFNSFGVVLRRWVIYYGVYIFIAGQFLSVRYCVNKEEKLIAVRQSGRLVLCIYARVLAYPTQVVPE